MVQFISFPIVFIGFTILVIQTAGFYLKRHVVSDKSIFGISHENQSFILILKQ